MAEALRVIRCGPEHLEAIRAIYNHEIVHGTALYEYEPRSADVMAAWWATKAAGDIPVFGVELDPGQLAGFATWGPFRPFPAYLHSVEHSVYVDPRYRRRGVGAAILEAVIREAVARRLHVLVGGIDAANTASRELHRRFGFAHVGTVREAGFKFDRWLDLEFWQRILPNNDPRYLAEASYTRGSS
ncbi:MAG: hypothetical protein RLZZ111_1143 [Planctomycetota bacterium]